MLPGSLLGASERPRGVFPRHLGGLGGQGLLSLRKPFKTSGLACAAAGALQGRLGCPWGRLGA
eukprot:9164053-Pyramimonas_sp.AAC.1